MDYDNEAHVNGPEDSTLEKQRRAQDFYDVCGPVPSYEMADFVPWLGQPFRLVGPDGPLSDLITLDEIEKKSPVELKRRKTVRKDPFIIDFVGPDKLGLADSLYKLHPVSEPEETFFLFLNTIDHIREDEIYVYQAIVN